jgi:hypothetical protein
MACRFAIPYVADRLMFKRLRHAAMSQSNGPNAGLTSRALSRGVLAPAQHHPEPELSLVHSILQYRFWELTVALLISVAPAGDGWAIQTDDLAEELVFPTGARAESAARAIARRKADEGMDAEIHIFIRGGALAGVVNVPSRHHVSANN